MNFIAFQNKWRDWTNKLYTRLVRSSFGAMGRDCQIMMPFKCYNPEDIFLGDNVVICGGSWVATFREYPGCQQFTPRLEIGDGTYIGHRSHIIVIGYMKIGKNVLIADKVYISDNLHGFEDITQSIMPQSLKHAPVTIEDEVWLGENVCVLPGVTIGRHSVIGSNAVVTRSIPPYSVVVGAPAKVIKQYNHEAKCWESIK